MRHIIIIISLLFNLTLFAQNNKAIDSLMNDFRKNYSVQTANLLMKEFAYMCDSVKTYKEKDLKDFVIADVIDYYSSHLFYQEDYPNALKYALETFDKATKLDDKQVIIDITSVLVGCYMRYGAFDKAIYYAKIGLDNDKKLGQKRDLLISLNNIATLYAKYQKFQSAEKYIQQALQLMPEVDKQEKITFVYGTASYIYKNLKLYDKGYQYAYEGYKLDSIAGLETDAAMRKYEMAENLYEKGEKKKALAMCEELMETFKKGGGLTAGYYVGALRMFGRNKEALEIVRKNGDVIRQESILRQLAEDAKNENKYNEGMKYLEEAIILHDSIVSTENGKMAERFNIEYESFEKDKEIAEQQAELACQQTEMARQHERVTIFTSIAIILAILIILVTIGFAREKRHKALLAKANQELKQANEVKDKLIRVISHDLSGTTANINMLAHMLSEKVKDELSNILTVQSDNLKSFLDNLLIWARMQRTGKVQISKTNMSLNELANDVIRLYSSAATQKNITLNIEGENDVIVNADRNILHCIIRNLLNNAIKFTPEGGTITLSFNKENISVTDTGCGMTPEMKECLLNGSQWIHTEGTKGEQGSGLGLSIVRDMIHMSGGHLEIDSKQGQGSTFRIIL